MASVSLKTIKAAAKQLKSYAANADRNGDGKLTAKELKNAGYSTGQLGAYAKASLSMFAATAKGAPTADLKDVLTTIDSTVKDLAGTDLNKDGFIQPGAEVSALSRSKRLGALYDFAPKSAVNGYGSYGTGASLLSLLSHCSGVTTKTYQKASDVPASLKAFMLVTATKAGAASTEAFFNAHAPVTVRKFKELHTDELHTLITYAGDTAGTLFANRAKEATAQMVNGTIDSRWL